IRIPRLDSYPSLLACELSELVDDPAGPRLFSHRRNSPIDPDSIPRETIPRLHRRNSVQRSHADRDTVMEWNPQLRVPQSMILDQSLDRIGTRSTLQRRLILSPRSPGQPSPPAPP